MISRSSYYSEVPGLTEAIENMILDSIQYNTIQDKRVLFYTDQYRIIGKLYREPSKKLRKPDNILCIISVKLTEPGFMNLQSPISKQEFQCKASRKKLKGKDIQHKIETLVQKVSLDIAYALVTRRRNLSPDVIRELLDHDE